MHKSCGHIYITRLLRYKHLGEIYSPFSLRIYPVILRTFATFALAFYPSQPSEIGVLPSEPSEGRRNSRISRGSLSRNMPWNSKIPKQIPGLNCNGTCPGTCIARGTQKEKCYITRESSPGCCTTKPLMPKFQVVIPHVRQTRNTAIRWPEDMPCQFCQFLVNWCQHGIRTDNSIH